MDPHVPTTDGAQEPLGHAPHDGRVDVVRESIDGAVGS